MERNNSKDNALKIFEALNKSNHNKGIKITTKEGKPLYLIKTLNFELTPEEDLLIQGIVRDFEY